jgi:hypothetical protein
LRNVGRARRPTSPSALNLKALLCVCLAAAVALDKLSAASFAQRALLVRADRGVDPALIAEREEKRKAALDKAAAAREAGLPPTAPRSKQVPQGLVH